MLSSLPKEAIGGNVYRADFQSHTLRKTCYSATAQLIRDRCVACSKAHFLYLCPNFQRMVVSSRDQLVRDHKLCRNCLSRGHQTTECLSRGTCRNCGTKHHTMLCYRSKITERNSQRRRSDEGFTSCLQKKASISTNKVKAKSLSGQTTSNVAVLAEQCCREQHGRNRVDKSHKRPLPQFFELPLLGHTERRYKPKHTSERNSCHARVNQVHHGATLKAKDYSVCSEVAGRKQQQRRDPSIRHTNVLMSNGRAYNNGYGEKYDDRRCHRCRRNGLRSTCYETEAVDDSEVHRIGKNVGNNSKE